VLGIIARVFFPFFFFFFPFSFSNTGAWTQGLTLARQVLYHLSLSAIPKLQGLELLSIHSSTELNPQPYSFSNMPCSTDNLAYIKILQHGQAAVVQACNPSYSGGRDQEDHSLKPAGANSFREPFLKIANKLGWQSAFSGSVCLASMRPWVQTPVLPKKIIMIKGLTTCQALC
jgi:hypothetical protein